MSLVLDDDHVYWLNGDRVLGCTEALGNVGLLDKAHYTDEGLVRGTKVHALIVERFEGRAGKKGHAQWGGYVDAAFRFLDESKAEPVFVEHSMADPMLAIAGTTDLIAQVQLRGVDEPRDAIIDWKTGQPERWHNYQTAWYEHLARVNGLVTGLVERIVVHLRNDGTYTIRTSRDRADWKVADAARIVEQAKRAA